jgi:hypothetical protein
LPALPEGAALPPLPPLPEEAAAAELARHLAMTAALPPNPPPTRNRR